MKITRSISSRHPDKCHMVVKGFFGKIKGRVEYTKDFHEGREGYNISVGGKYVGGCTDFFHACDTLLQELKILKTICADAP